MTEQTAADFDGCNLKCRQAGAHTLVYGQCEHGTPPEPTVSLSAVYTAADGFPAIGFDTYTVQQLAELITAALRASDLPVNGDDLVDVGVEAARAIVHRNGLAPAVPAGQAPATDADPAAPELTAALADDLRYALSYRDPGHAHDRPGVWNTSGKPCGHCARLAVARQNLAAYDADAAVLPASVDRATVLEEGASHLEARAAEFTAAARKDPLAFVKGATDARYRTADCWDAAAAELRRLAAASAVVVRRATDETPGARHAPGTAILCPDCSAKGHAVCMDGEACGRTKSVAGVEYPPCARPAGHPEAYCRSADGKQHFLAVLGPRPAVTPPAVGAQQPKENRPSPTEELLATRCDACRHTLNRHHQHGACTVVLCVCGTFQYPVEELPQ